MRLLNTSTGQFVWIADPSTVRYAILSHTWRSESEGGEQSYEDFRRLQTTTNNTPVRLLNLTRGNPSRSRRPSILSHVALSDKIKGFCKIARDAGYELVWIDSCCIDSSSSAELSEAINSMYQWYRLADVCYVYLEDVPDNDKPAGQDSAFRTSRWGTRGWTLQELIAPKRVVFLTQTWRSLGTKMGLASTIEEVTGIDFAILTGTAGLESMSIARRMSWAAGRKTTRIEDEAYCLMGLFDVHMPTIYGEGRNAFLRLQEEIIKTIPDQSIFAWGRSCTVMYDILKNRAFVPQLPDEPTCLLEESPHRLGLLALSPQDFKSARDVVPLPLEDFMSLLGEVSLDDNSNLPSLHCLFTPQGVALHLLLLDVSPQFMQIPDALLEYCKGSVESISCLCSGSYQSLALLRCQDQYGSLVALPLSRTTETVTGRVQESLVVALHTACTIPEYRHPRTIRLAKCTLAIVHLQLTGPGRSRQIYIRRHGSTALHDVDSTSTTWRAHGFGRVVTAYIPDGVTEDLATSGFHNTPLDYRYADTTGYDGCQTVTAATIIHSSTCAKDGTQDPCQDIKVSVILTQKKFGNPYAHFSVDHFFHTTLLRNSNSSTYASGQLLSADDDRCDSVVEVPCADDSDGRSTSTIRRTKSGTLHTKAEFILHADADWEICDTPHTRLLRIAVRGTPDEHAAGHTFQFTVELSERRRPIRQGDALPIEAPPAEVPPKD